MVNIVMDVAMAILPNDMSSSMDTVKSKDLVDLNDSSFVSYLEEVEEGVLSEDREDDASKLLSNIDILTLLGLSQVQSETNIALEVGIKGVELEGVDSVISTDLIKADGVGNFVPTNVVNSLKLDGSFLNEMMVSKPTDGVIKDLEGVDIVSSVYSEVDIDVDVDANIGVSKNIKIKDSINRSLDDTVSLLNRIAQKESDESLKTVFKSDTVDVNLNVKGIEEDVFIGESINSDDLNSINVGYSKGVNVQSLLDVDMKNTLLSNIVKEPVILQKDTLNQDMLANLNYMSVKGIQKLKMQLSPKDLGSMVVEIVKSGDSSKLLLTVGQSDVYKLVQTNIKELTNYLGDMGLNITELSVTYEDSLNSDFNFNSNEDKQFNRDDRYSGGSKEEVDDVSSVTESDMVGIVNLVNDNKVLLRV